MLVVKLRDMNAGETANEKTVNQAMLQQIEFAAMEKTLELFRQFSLPVTFVEVEVRIRFDEILSPEQCAALSNFKLGA
jgi:hypothetical protein